MFACSDAESVDMFEVTSFPSWNIGVAMDRKFF